MKSTKDIELKFSVRWSIMIYNIDKFWENLKGVELEHFQKSGRLAWNDPMNFIFTNDNFWSYILLNFACIHSAICFKKILTF